MFSANSSQVSEDRLFVEDVFSTYLYTGNGSTQTITNGIDLAGKGGLVWIKARGANGQSNNLIDTSRGVGNHLYSNYNFANQSIPTGLTAFNNNGFSLGSSSQVNFNADNFASWTFRKAPKFFDVVTYTGNGVSGRAISHSLGVAPGCILIKRTDAAQDWVVYHRNNGTTGYTGFSINTTNASIATLTGGDLPTATTFKPSAFFGSDINGANINGATFVAYLFAHDATSDGIIQCGSYTTTGSDQEINLGWEPQWVLIKNTDLSDNPYTGWGIFDTMRGFTVDLDAPLLANSSSAENGTYNASTYNYVDPTPTGFKVKSGTTLAGAGTAGYKYIYIAIRRGPMRTPTSGTSVFSPTLTSSYGVNNLITTGFPVDLCIGRVRANGYSTDAFDRLRGTAATSGRWLSTNTTDAEQTNGFYGVGLTSNTGFFSNWWTQDVGVQWNFRRAPSFMDVVCYTGTGSTRTVNHNLGVTPELMIAKWRGGTESWYVTTTPFTSGHLILDLTNSKSAFDICGANPTSSTFTVTNSVVNRSGGAFVAYLFASCPGVSKVGSYTGNGSSQTINCGFAAGARFVLIKRTDSTGDWYVWDSARGIVAGNDPRLSLNTTAAEVTTDDSVDTDSSGFVVNQLSATNINVSSATYIYLAVA